MSMPPRRRDEIAAPVEKRERRELSCRLLETAVRGLHNMPPAEPSPVNIDPPGEAWLPRDDGPDAQSRLDVYRRLSRAIAERGPIAEWPQMSRP